VRAIEVHDPDVNLALFHRDRHALSVFQSSAARMP
jgi:hypothetical protein